MNKRKIEQIRTVLNQPGGKENDPERIKKAIRILLDHYDTSELMEFEQHIETLLNRKRNEKQKD